MVSTKLLALLCLSTMLQQLSVTLAAEPVALDGSAQVAAEVATEVGEDDGKGGEGSSAVVQPPPRVSKVVVGAADGADDHIRSHLEVRCKSMKYVLSCDLNKDCNTIACTGMAGEEVVDALTPEDAAELLQSAVDVWATDANHTCRARETLGEGPTCIDKLFVYASS